MKVLSILGMLASLIVGMCGLRVYYMGCDIGDGFLNSGRDTAIALLLCGAFLGLFSLISTIREFQKKG